MNKKELLNVPLDTIKRDSFNENIEADIQYFISAKTVLNSKKERILVLSFFSKELILKYRLFINKKERQYITQEIMKENSKWHTGTVENIFLDYWIKNMLLINKKSTDNILKYFKVKEYPLAALDAFQKSIVSQKLIKKHKKKTDYIDAIMKTIPNLPRDFKRWADEIVLTDSRYIYYKYERTTKPIHGYCTHCKQEVIISNPKHNAEGICPNCKSKIIYKAEGKSLNIKDNACCIILQKVDDNIVIRYFEVYKIYGTDYRNPKLEVYERVRDFYNGNDYKTFEFRRYASTNTIRWCQDMLGGLFSHSYDFQHIVLYDKNLDTVLRGTSLQYSQIKQYATQKQGYKFPVYSYIDKYKEYPFMEYLFKLKLTNLVKEIIGSYNYTLEETFNIHGKSFTEILKLNKKYIPVMQRLNIGLRGLKVLQETYKKNISLTDEEIKYVSENFYKEDFFYISEYATPTHIIKYVKSQIENKETPQYILQDWVDYIKNCILLNYNLSNDFIMFPKNLQERHDELIPLIKQEKLKAYNQKINERYNKLSSLYSWEYKDYFICVANSADSLIAEGQALHHCVGTYSKAMAIGETVILFLRHKKEPNKSFYTIEVKKNEVCQFRGYKNCEPTPELKKIIEMFKKEKLTEHEQLRQAV